MAETKKTIWKRWYMVVLYVFVGLMIIGALLPDSNNSQTNTNSNVNVQPTGNVVNQQNTETITTPTTTPAVEEQSDKATLGERNALKSAQSYLKYSGFSEKGLEDQLDYEGYTSLEINYAINNVEVDWNEEAYESAESYLKYSSFSKQELHDQLEYEGFTESQIQYALEQVGY